MSVEFVDTNVLVYAHALGAGRRHSLAVDLLSRLIAADSLAVSFQVLSEFYSTMTRKLRMEPRVAEAVVADMAGWRMHTPGHADILRAIKLQRRYQMSWWDALILNSAIETGSRVLWTEDFSHGQTYGGVQVKNPFL